MKSIFTRCIILSAFVFGFIFIAESCKTVSLTNKPIDFNPETSENGLIIGSITFPTVPPRFMEYYPYIQGVDNKNSTEFTITPETRRAIKHDGELNNGKTYLFAIERKPGNYEINKIRVTANAYNTSWGDDIRNFTIPFEIKKGEITYVGEIFFDEYEAKNDKSVTLSDKAKRDIDGLKLKQPAVDWSKAKRGPLKINKR